MDNVRRIIPVLLLALMLAGCGGEDNGEVLVQLELKNLSRLSGPFNYTAWVQADGNIVMLETFNTGADNNITFRRFAFLETIETGDRVFVTIEPDPDPEPGIPTDTVVLTGTVTGNTAVLVFPRLQDFANASAFVSVNEFATNQLLLETENLPDLADLNFIYQGFLDRDGILTPLQKFRFNETPISFTAPFPVTTAHFFVTIEPVNDFDPNSPYSMRPFFTVGDLVPVEDQPLVRSSLVPDDPSFRFSSGLATVR